MYRREFFKRVCLAGVPFFLPGFDFIKDYSDYKLIKPVKNQKFAKVVEYRDPLCVSPDFKINEKRASELFKKALMEFTGKPTISEAAKSLFPTFRGDLRVSIKINTASDTMTSRKFMAYAVADCLVQAGLKPDNIIIWERAESTLKSSGYEIVNDPGKIKVVATDTKGYKYDESRSEQVHGVHVHLTTILTEHSDYQINLGVMKHHWFTGAAVCLKNHYGSIPLLDAPFIIGPYDVAKLHFNACDPYMSELFATIEDKVPTVLFICDGLLAAYNNGPLGPPQWVQNEIMLSNDPVAIDTLAFYKIEKKRLEIGLPPLLNKAMFLRTSALMELGTNNLNNMDIIQKVV